MSKAKVTTTETKTTRPPIVAVMGHVDHGKTTLLDSLRGANVAASEAGGITQNTRAHQITTPNGNKITFIDTPGHEAFANMRSRGAEVTDLVLLVVAADDGLQPQTIQSIKFAQEHNTPIIVAINKIDLEIKSLDKLKAELSAQGVNIEEYGGDVMVYPISALKKTGLNELLEGIELFVEINGLSETQLPNDKVDAQAYVLESKLDKRLGPVALCVLKAGKINGGETGLTSTHPFSTRAMLDEWQKPMATVNVSDPFWVTGLRSPVDSGEKIYFTKDKKQADELIAELFPKQIADAPTEAINTDDLILQMLAASTVNKEDEDKQLAVIIKAGSHGTLEAILTELQDFVEDNSIKILDQAIGEVNERDIERAKLAKGIVLCFQLPINKKIAEIAKRERVLVRSYEIIYEMLDEIALVIESFRSPAFTEVEVAKAKIKKVFTLTNGDVVAGSEVISGIINRGYDAKIVRGKEELARTKISQLRVLKDEVKEVRKGQECGIMLVPPFPELQEDDLIITFKLERN